MGIRSSCLNARRTEDLKYLPVLEAADFNIVVYRFPRLAVKDGFANGQGFMDGGNLDLGEGGLTMATVTMVLSSPGAIAVDDTGRAWLISEGGEEGTYLAMVGRYQAAMLIDIRAAVFSAPALSMSVPSLPSFPWVTPFIPAYVSFTNVSRAFRSDRPALTKHLVVALAKVGVDIDAASIVPLLTTAFVLKTTQVGKCCAYLASIPSEHPRGLSESDRVGIMPVQTAVIKLPKPAEPVVATLKGKRPPVDVRISMEFHSKESGDRIKSGQCVGSVRGADMRDCSVNMRSTWLSAEPLKSL